MFSAFGPRNNVLSSNMSRLSLDVFISPPRCGPGTQNVKILDRPPQASLKFIEMRILVVATHLDYQGLGKRLCAQGTGVNRRNRQPRIERSLENLFYIQAAIYNSKHRFVITGRGGHFSSNQQDRKST